MAMMAAPVGPVTDQLPTGPDDRSHHGEGDDDQHTDGYPAGPLPPLIP